MVRGHILKLRVLNAWHLTSDTCTELYFVPDIQLRNIQLAPCHSSGGQSLALHRGGPGSSPGQVMWDLRWTKWHWGRFSPITLVSPVNLHSTNGPTITSIYHLGLVQWANSGRSTKWTQSHPTKNNKRKHTATWQSSQPSEWLVSRPLAVKNRKEEGRNVIPTLPAVAARRHAATPGRKADDLLGFNAGRGQCIA
jgi:hypothetical protein